MEFRDGFEDLSTEDKLNTTLSYVMNLETIIAKQEEKVKALEHSKNIQDAVIEMLVEETHWVNEQLAQVVKNPRSQNGLMLICYLLLRC